MNADDADNVEIRVICVYQRPIVFNDCVTNLDALRRE